MSDKPYLLFDKKFNALHPANQAGADAIKAIEGRCRIEVKRYGANERRRGFYWTMLDVAAGALTDATDFPFDAELLHETLKRKLGLGETYTTPSGDTIFKPRSTSNRSMTELERSQWTDRCSTVLSNWLGVEVSELMREARERNAA